MSGLIRDTDIYNHLHQDPLLDWLEIHGESKGFDSDRFYIEYDPRLDFTCYVREKTCLFKDKCAEALNTLLGDEKTDLILQITEDSADIWKKECHDNTVEAMKKGVPIIRNAVLHNPELKVACMIDFLIAGHLVEQLTSFDIHRPGHPIPPYLVLNSVFVGLHFTVEKDKAPRLKSTPALNYHKAKLWIHIHTLNLFQPTSHKGLLLGRKWESIHECSFHAFDRLGVVDLADVLTRDPKAAIAWCHNLKSEGKHWDVLPIPSVRELYPNMKNRQSGKWRKAKKKIALQLSEITLMWHITYVQRQTLHDAKVFRLDQIDDIVRLLEIDQWQYAPGIRAIQKINKRGPKLVLPEFLTSTKFEWWKKKFELFVDFETVSSIGDPLDKFPIQCDTTLIAMIGCGYIEPGTKKWIYKCFSVDLLITKEEHRIVKEWFKWMEDVCLKWMGEIPAQFPAWCFSRAEANFLEDQRNSCVHRHDVQHWKHRVDWLDLQELLRDEPFVIKGCHNFSLKSIVHALFDQKKLDVIWPSSQIDDGLSAMIGLFRAHEEAIEQNTTMGKIPWMDDIMSYNALDCLAMYKILDYLRRFHNRFE